MDRRNMLKFLGAMGLGAVAAETYETLHHIPLLERRFVDEVNYWINQYNSAKDAVDKLLNQLRQQEGEISNLRDEVNYWRAQYSSKSEEVGKLTLTVNKLDELERESTSSIAYYREKMGEAIKRLRETIEKYRAILGGERRLLVEAPTGVGKTRIALEFVREFRRRS
jgi:type I site-specific restriction endonuclease